MESASVDLFFANREELVGDVITGGCLGYSGHEMIEFSIFKELRSYQNPTLDFQRADVKNFILT